MKLERALQIFEEYSSVFTVVKPEPMEPGLTVRIFLVDNFDRQEIVDYAFKIEGDMLLTFFLFYNELRGLICGRWLQSNRNLQSLDESTLRYKIEQKIREFHQVKLNLRRNDLKEL